MTETARKKIVIIEDNLDYSQLLQRVLSKAGYEVKVFNDPKDALPKIAAENPDLLILDVMLPGMSGLSILEELKKKDLTSKIPIFCLTNLPEEVGREKALALGAYCYLTKAHYNIYDIQKQVEFFFKEKGEV